MANEQPTVYLFVADEQARDISISSFPVDHPDYERYHLLIREGGGNHKTPTKTSLYSTQKPLVTLATSISHTNAPKYLV
jgi:hypothetical protein